MRTSGLLLFTLVALLTPAVSPAAVTIKQSSTAVSAPAPKESPWSLGFTYGFSTDLADAYSPRIYYQGLNAFAARRFGGSWSASLGVAATFTTLDGQIDKRQEDTELEAAGVSPSVGLSYGGSDARPWFFGISGTALMDSASRREGFLGLFSGNFGGTWRFFNDRLSMTHGLAISEIINAYEYSSAGTPNPGTSVSYSWSNSIAAGDHLTVNAGFGLKQTRYLDGFWDYSYNTFLGTTLAMGQWSLSLNTSNGGYTEDGRVSLWYVDKYRRVVSLALAVNF